CEYIGAPDQVDSDCDNVVDECDVCPGSDDAVDANEDGEPDCLTLPEYDDIDESWKCGNNKVIITHIPPDNPTNIRELCVSYNSVPSHLASGSFLGPISACDQIGARTLPTQRQASFTSTELTTFPNPAHDLINITWTSNKSEMVKLNIIGINGQLINRTEKNTHPGINSIKEDISQLENGIYFIKMNAPSHSEIIKFIKT
ncbi:MAG: T9SS type A sorting domain-containing protein, partial [Saprospiraceae bacterium]|nr:T9SS type A sorting domain-containing protein [Saprospiraceae bacterium]